MKNDVITGITTAMAGARVYLIGVPLLAEQIKKDEALAVKRRSRPPSWRITWEHR